MPKTKTAAIALAGCGGFAVLMVASCAGLLYVGYQNTDSAVSPKIDAMFSAIENENFAGTYETDTTQALRDTVTMEQFVALGDAIRLKLGKLQSKSLRGFKMRQHNADSFIEVTYRAAFENGTGTITAKLEKQRGEWKFVAFRVDSPVFDQDTVSPDFSANEQD